jgi:hypothetical protein
VLPAAGKLVARLRQGAKNNSPNKKRRKLELVGMSPWFRSHCWKELFSLFFNLISL